MFVATFGCLCLFSIQTMQLKSKCRLDMPVVLFALKLFENVQLKSVLACS